MNQALDEMRINWENKVNIKELQIINNPLFERRMKKTKTENAPRTAAPTQPLNITKPTEQSKLIVEDLTREPSMMSVRSITPTNSRRASPERDTKNKDDNTQFLKAIISKIILNIYIHSIKLFYYIILTIIMLMVVLLKAKKNKINI